MASLLLRAVLLLIPAPWRGAVAIDLAEDARAQGHGTLWCVWHAARIAVMLRWTFSGDLGLADFRRALRSLAGAKWFTIGAILTFALGIGANVAVFSAVDRMTFRPLPYGDVARLYVLSEVNRTTGEAYSSIPANWVAGARGRVAGIRDLAVIADEAQHFALTREPNADAVLSALPATFNTLNLLGVRPIRGRDFGEDDARDKRGLVLISYETWQARFGGRDDVVGSRLWCKGRTAEIIGVLPKDFLPPSIGSQKRLGLSLDPDLMTSAKPDERSYPPIVRLAPGATTAGVETALGPLVEEYRQQLPAREPGRPPYAPGARLDPVGRVMFDFYRTYVWLVAVAAGLVLLVACANLASLLLVRGRSREHEIAVRLALGATPGRLVRTALFESAALAVAGAGVALAVIAWTDQSLHALMPATFAGYAESVGDPRVAGFALLAAIICALLAGLLPGLRVARVDVLPTLQSAGARGRTSRLRGGASLLAIESAIGVVLVAGAAVTARNLIGLMWTDIGFNPADLHAVTVIFPLNAQASEAATYRQYSEALAIIRGLPGVRSAAGADVMPISKARGNLFAKGYEDDGLRYQLTDEAFETMGIPVLAGRTFGAAEIGGGADVAVLSARGAQRIWPGVRPADAVGRRLDFAGEPSREVIGVVGDVRRSYAGSVIPSIYLPIQPSHFKWMMFVARVEPGAEIPVALLRDRLRQGVGEPATVGAGLESESFQSDLRDDRFRAILFVSFGAIGLVLAAIGLYAVASFEVEARQLEMGVRLSLGATPGQVSRRVLGDALKPVLAGIGGGLAVCYWAGQFLQAFLHQVDARDPATLALVALTLIGSAATAAWLPARRAARTDPATALRSQ